FYFRLYQGTVKSAQVIDFLQALLQHLSGPLLIVGDRLSAHRSRITRDFMAAQGACESAAAPRVPKQVGLAASTVRSIDLRYLERWAAGRRTIIGATVEPSAFQQTVRGTRFPVRAESGYAPELNPVEYIWGYWKQHALTNVCPKDYWGLDQTARRTLPT